MVGEGRAGRRTRRLAAVGGLVLWWAVGGAALGVAASECGRAAPGLGAAAQPVLSSPTSAPEPAYLPPVDGVVTRLFDPPAVRWGSGHRGVDLAAPPGAAVRSPGPGVVAFAGPVAGRGVVTVLHDDGLRSSLEPVDAVVAPGDRVERSGVLGTLQDRPAHEGVHWGVRDGEDYLDPLSLLIRSSPVVLLPPSG